MRCLRFTLLTLLFMPALAFEQPSLRCESDESHDARNFECQFDADGASKLVRFSASLSGSHDDTAALLVAYLNGTPLMCDEGSKTSLEGEDGDVTLDCRFAIAPSSKGPQRLNVKLTWRHAIYTNFRFSAEPLF